MRTEGRPAGVGGLAAGGRAAVCLAGVLARPRAGRCCLLAPPPVALAPCRTHTPLPCRSRPPRPYHSAALTASSSSLPQPYTPSATTLPPLPPYRQAARTPSAPVASSRLLGREPPSLLAPPLPSSSSCSPQRCAARPRRPSRPPFCSARSCSCQHQHQQVRPPLAPPPLAVARSVNARALNLTSPSSPARPPSQRPAHPRHQRRSPRRRLWRCTSRSAPPLTAARRRTPPGWARCSTSGQTSAGRLATSGPASRR